jgi:hypothetical protein
MADIQQKTPSTRSKKSLKAIKSRVFQTLARRCSHQLTSNVVAKPTGTPNTPAEMG